MFFLKNKKLIDKGFFRGFTDVHSHILPCVDDGSKSLEESLEILDRYEHMGIERVIFTPHIMEEYPNNSSQSLRATFEQFKTSYNGNVKLSLAAEYMLDAKFNQHLASGDMLTLWDNNLLVECSYISPPVGLWDMIYNMSASGYQAVLAHPERYKFLDDEDFRILSSMGVKYQVNLLSLTGYYGGMAKDKAQKIIDNGECFAIGTDIHKISTIAKWIEPMRLPKKSINTLLDIKSCMSQQFKD